MLIMINIRVVEKIVDHCDFLFLPEISPGIMANQSIMHQTILNQMINNIKRV